MTSGCHRVVSIHIFDNFCSLVEENKENEGAEPDSTCLGGDGEVSNLNKALLKWIEKHITENSVCDLRPIFEDYRKHMERIDKVRI